MTTINKLVVWYAKRVMWVCVSKKDQVCKGNTLWKGMVYMANSGNKMYVTSKSTLKDFTVDALTASASNLFQNGIARTLSACWRRSCVAFPPVIMRAMPQMNTIYKGNTETPFLTQSGAILRRGNVLSCMNQDNTLLSQEKGLRGLFIRLQHLIINFTFVVRALFV